MRLSATTRLGAGESLTSNIRRQINLSGLHPEDDVRQLVDWLRVTNFASGREISQWSDLTDQPTNVIRTATFRAVTTALPAFGEVLGHRQPLRAAARRTWLWPQSTQACRSCLRERPGQWQLLWRLPWSFICLDHRRLLETHCRVCQRQLTEHHECPPRRSSPEAHWILWNGNEAGQDESNLAGRIAAASVINSALRGEAIKLADGLPAHPAEYLEAVRGLVGLQWHSQQPKTTGRRVVAAPPRDPTSRAVLITTATRLLAEPSDRCVSRLDELLRRVDRRSGFHAWLVDHSSRSSILDPILTALADREKSTGRIVKPASNAARSMAPDSIPQVLDERMWAKINLGWSGGQIAGRCYAALSYVKYTQAMTWLDAARLLEIPQKLGYSVSRVGARNLTSRPSDFVEQVAHLMEIPDPEGPIDYADRRAFVTGLAADTMLLSSMRNELGRPHLNTSLLTERVWTLWAGGHPLLTPGLASAERIDRQRAATQRKRWTPEDTTRLIRWCERASPRRHPTPAATL